MTVKMTINRPCELLMMTMNNDDKRLLEKGLNKYYINEPLRGC